MHRSPTPPPTTESLLLACDLDRTVIPNGSEPRHEESEAQFATFITKPSVTLAYVTGRSLLSATTAIADHQLPQPDIMVGDVGTSIYWKKDERYIADILWQSRMNDEWHGLTQAAAARLLRSTIIATSRPQEPENQGQFKLSYYTDHDPTPEEIQAVKEILAINNITANVVSSFDVVGKFGYLDILPASADKAAALSYLAHKLRLTTDQVVFAGDSGNDLAALTCGVRGIVVNNASAEFKAAATAAAQDHQLSDRLYIAHGALPHNPGHYSGGIVEGLVHFGFLSQ